MIDRVHSFHAASLPSEAVFPCVCPFPPTVLIPGTAVWEELKKKTLESFRKVVQLAKKIRGIYSIGNKK